MILLYNLYLIHYFFIEKIKPFSITYCLHWIIFFMLVFCLKIFFSSLIISFASWLSFKKPQLAGFIIALPLISIIALAFSYLEHKDFEKTITSIYDLNSLFVIFKEAPQKLKTSNTRRMSVKNRNRKTRKTV